MSRFKNEYYKVECRFCINIIGYFKEKEIKGNVTCQKCNCIQPIIKAETIPFTKSRNYSEGYFE